MIRCLPVALLAGTAAFPAPGAAVEKRVEALRLVPSVREGELLHAKRSVLGARAAEDSLRKAAVPGEHPALK